MRINYRVVLFVVTAFATIPYMALNAKSTYELYNEYRSSLAEISIMDEERDRINRSIDTNYDYSLNINDIITELNNLGELNVKEVIVYKSDVNGDLLTLANVNNINDISAIQNADVIDISLETENTVTFLKSIEESTLIVDSVVVSPTKNNITLRILSGGASGV